MLDFPGSRDKTGGKNREFLDKLGMFSCFSKATPDVPAAPNPRFGSSQEPFSRETPGIPAFFRVLGSPGTIPAGITMDFTGKIPPVIPNSSPSLSLSTGHSHIPSFPRNLVWDLSGSSSGVFPFKTIPGKREKPNNPNNPGKGGRGSRGPG